MRTTDPSRLEKKEKEKEEKEEAARQGNETATYIPADPINMNRNRLKTVLGT